MQYDSKYKLGLLFSQQSKLVFWKSSNDVSLISVSIMTMNADKQHSPLFMIALNKGSLLPV